MSDQPASDGIDSLSAAFRRPPRERTIPPARHKPRDSTVPMAPPPVSDPQPTEAEQTAKPQERPAEVRSLRVRSRQASESTPRAGSLSPSTVSLDRRTEEVLEAVRTAGRFADPKVDANRSATIRLAVARLAEQMTPEQIADELRRRAPVSQTIGRKRL